MKHRFFESRLFAGLSVLAAVVALGGVVAFALGMLPLPGDAAVEPAFGPDRIAFVSDRDGDDEIYVMNADGSGVVQLTDNDSDDRYPAWSPDGGRIAFVSDRDNDEEIEDIYVMNEDGSGVEQLTDDCSNRLPDWSPDGDRIAFHSRGDIYVMNADGSGVGQLTGTPPESCGHLFVSDRDGEAKWYVRNPDGSVELYDWNSGVGDWNSLEAGPKWSPDGSRIALYAMRDGIFGVYVMNADGSGFGRLSGSGVEYVRGVAWSPDGDRVAFGGRSGNRDDRDIYVMNADGSGVLRLTNSEGHDYGPTWSPDGRRIAFSSDRDGVTGVYVVNEDGSGVERLADGHNPAWSPLLE